MAISITKVLKNQDLPQIIVPDHKSDVNVAKTNIQWPWQRKYSIWVPIHVEKPKKVVSS